MNNQIKRLLPYDVSSGSYILSQSRKLISKDNSQDDSSIKTIKKHFYFRISRKFSNFNSEFYFPYKIHKIFMRNAMVKSFNFDCI